MRTPAPFKFSRLIDTLKRYKLDFKEGGFNSLKPILSDSFSKFHRLLLSKEKYYMYSYDLVNKPSIPNINPKIDNILMNVYFSDMSMEEFESLLETGYDFLKDKRVRYFSDNDKGIIIFYGMVNEKVAYQACVANHRTGVYQYACPKDYDSRKVAYQGLNFTSHEFRRKGLYTWGQCEMLRFFKDQGYEEMVMLEAQRLDGMRRIQDRIGAKILYESYVLRALFFFSFRWNKY